MELTLFDGFTFVAFLAIVLGISLYASGKEDDSGDYFLAGRNLTWGLTNISTEHSDGYGGRRFRQAVRKLPTGPVKSDKFTAVNTNLKYSEGWDSPWPVGIGADVVRFEETPCEFVFWKGAEYQPHFDTSRGQWFSNGVNEGGNEHGSGVTHV